MNVSERLKYERAKRKVSCIKSFYNHLMVYLIFNIPLLLLRINFIPVFRINIENWQLQSWLDWNTYGITFIWGIGLLVHWVLVFKFKFDFFEEWEKKKIKDIITKEENKSKKPWD